MLKGRFFIMNESGLLCRIGGHIQYVSEKVKAVMYYITSQDGAIMFDDYRKAEMFKAQNRKLIGNGRIVEIY